MFLISSKLTLVMLCVVPPVSIGAVSWHTIEARKADNSGILRPIPTEIVKSHSRSRWRNVKGKLILNHPTQADDQTAEEKLNAFKTVTAYNSQPMEGDIFSKRVDGVFQLAKKEAYMTGIFWGASGLTGNLAMLCLLGYGAFDFPISVLR